MMGGIPAEHHCRHQNTDLYSLIYIPRAPNQNSSKETTRITKNTLHLIHATTLISHNRALPFSSPTTWSTSSLPHVLQYCWHQSPNHSFAYASKAKSENSNRIKQLPRMSSMLSQVAVRPDCRGSEWLIQTSLVSPRGDAEPRQSRFFKIKLPSATHAT